MIPPESAKRLHRRPERRYSHPELLGTGSREVFQSISLRAYDKPTVKRISYAEKRKAMAHSAAVDSVDALMEWERQTGCFTEDDE